MDYFTVFGRKFGIVAEFHDTEEGTKQANAYMEAHRDTGLLAAEDGRLIIAKLADKGIGANDKPAKPPRPTLPNINKAIAELDIMAELVKGKEYFYFVGEALDYSKSTSVMVPRVSDLTVAEWLEELQSMIKEK